MQLFDGCFGYPLVAPFIRMQTVFQIIFRKNRSFCIQKGPVKIGKGPYFADTLCVMESLIGRTVLGFMSRENTAIGIVATNAKLNKEQINKVAQMAQDGLARTVCPAHTMLDGDTIFALATGEKKADVNIVGAFAAEVFAQAVLRAVRTAKPAAGLPCAAEVES